MLINPKTQQISITDANQNFSKVAKVVDKEKMVVILKQNKPKYLVIEWGEVEKLKNNAEDEEWEEASKKMLFKNLAAYKELAK